GTIANVIILLGIVPAYGDCEFKHLVRNELQVFLSKAKPEKRIVTKEMIQTLPVVIQKWLLQSGVVGKELIYTVRLKQKGQMRLKPDGKWMPVEAMEYFTVDTPGFIWIANVNAGQLMHLAARDKYDHGKGQMLIKALSVLPVVKTEGKEIDQGTLLRYLAEIVWFPSAALCNYISWEEAGPSSAKATMKYGSIEASGIFTFNEAGEVIQFEAQRYYQRKEGATLETWIITTDTTSFKEFDGIRIPAKSSVTWRLKTGDFTWFNLEVTDVEYNFYNH
ncbi:MAG TPA: DUF6544 family protein, partial [Segetibacter sp.]